MPWTPPVERVSPILLSKTSSWQVQGRDVFCVVNQTFEEVDGADIACRAWLGRLLRRWDVYESVALTLGQCSRSEESEL